MITKRTFSIEKDGFCGAWYPCSRQTTKGMILMLGDSSDDLMARKGAEWVNDLNCHVMAMSAEKKRLWTS